MLAIACSSGSSSTGPSGGSANLSATIDGASFLGTVQAKATRTVSGGDTIITVGGANTGEAIIIGMAFSDSGARTYFIGGFGEPANALINEGSATWASNIAGGTGSITVDTISATRVTGTFQFDAVPVSGSGASGTQTVTNGKFALSF
jgi:Family of unknown function (DUF6252)